MASFRTALAARERMGNPANTRAARWAVAWTLRSLKRHAEALAVLRRLEQECADADAPDGHVFEELAENLLLAGQVAPVLRQGARRTGQGPFAGPRKRRAAGAPAGPVPLMAVIRSVRPDAQ